MKTKISKILLALMFMGFLMIPPGIIGVSEDESIIPEEEEVINNVISGSEGLTIERVDASELNGILDEVDFGNTDYSVLKMNAHADSRDLWSQRLVNSFGFEMAPNSYMAMETRASDDEQSESHWDMYNGSVIATADLPEQISGTLDSKTVAANSDRIDWYKIEMPGVNPMVGGNIANFTMTLDTFKKPDDSTGDDLYELRITGYDENDMPEFEHDYIDIIQMHIVHNDYWNGQSFKGGHEFVYDDKDDTDSWTHDGNWTFNWRADLKSEGIQDNNGLGDGLTELNWYYIGISHMPLSVQGSPTRTPFDIEYKFTISAPVWESDNVYSNDWKNATDPGDHVDGLLSSLKDQNDWFQVTGGDLDKIWVMDFYMNRTLPVEYDIGEWDFATHISYFDAFMSFYVLQSHWGEDQIWGNDDDGYYGFIITYNWYLTGMMSSNWVLLGPAGSGQVYNGYRYTSINNMTGGTADQRKVYVGVVLEAVCLAFNTANQWIGYYLPAFGVSEEYSLDYSMSQVPLNNPPEITNITVVSSNPQHERGGNYDDEFDIIVTYMDEDNNEPNELWIEIDPGYGKSPENISAQVFEVDPFDDIYSDGKEYHMTFTGASLRDDPEFHTVTAKAKDKLSANSIQTPRWSQSLEAVNLIRVWNDEPPELNNNFVAIDSIREDSETVSQPLDNYVDGMFRDAEGFTGFYIWNTSLGDEGDWDLSYDTELFHVDIVEEYNLWYAKITPKHNQHGQGSLRLKGYDDYMSVEGSWPVTITEVNDPPMVFSIDIGGTIIAVDNTDPLWPIARLEGEKVLEDKVFTFQIIAEDQDLEGERQDLEYSFVRALSDGWDADIEVTWNTGEVSFEPTNNDVKAGNSKMIFGISDNKDEGEIKLEVRFEVTNVNGAPEISIPTITQRTYTQFREVRIKPVAADDDPDDTKTFSVNMLSAIGADADSIEDQLPFSELREEVDWGINSATGEFWFKVDDQNIWKTSTGMESQVEITLVFEVEDSEGLTAIADIVLILTDENEEPDKPVEIFYEIEDEDDVTAGIQSLNVNFWVDPVSDPDEDKLRYRWDFGDGQTGEGINVNHTYAKGGPKNVQMWVEDDEYQTDRIAQQIDLEEPVDDNGGTIIDPTKDPTITTAEDDNTIWIIMGIIAAVLFLALIVGAFVILRKKPAPEGYYDPNMYGAQGLPPAHSGELPPASTQGGLPPAGQQPQGLPPAQTQTAAAPASSPADKAPQGPAGSSCGNCGSPVDPSWFLCPNCKSPLQ